jgi:acetyl-CoA carboxylase carboxyltransferase component
LQAIEAPEERAATYEKMVAEMYKRGKAVNLASHFELDDVIEPADTQKWISRGLRSMP